MSRYWIDPKREPRPRARFERGFSLLEVLVAFVILALVATALFRLFSGALVNASAADDYTHAVLVAESVLAEAAATQPLIEATNNGTADDGKISWTTQVTPYDPPEVATATGVSGTPGMSADFQRIGETTPMRLFRVSAEVTFPAPSGGTRTFSLATMRLGPRNPQLVTQ